MRAAYIVSRARHTTPPHHGAGDEFYPVTVTVSSRLPAGAIEGETEVAPGTGFCVPDDEEEEELLPPQPGEHQRKGADAADRQNSKESVLILRSVTVSVMRYDIQFHNLQ